MFDTYTTPEEFKEQNGYTYNGTWFPRVTKIVGIKSKPALLYYYAQAPDFKTANAQTKKSAEEGTLVHEVAEKILVGDVPVVPPSIAPSIYALKQFLEDHDIEVVPEHVERRIINPVHRYAGTIDAMATINGKFGVLDIKTSQAIYRDYDLQTSAYMDALIREPDFKKLETRWILRIDQIEKCLVCGASRRTKGGREKVRAAKVKNGSPFCRNGDHEWGPMEGDIELVECHNWQDDFEGFLGAKRLWEWENTEWLRKIGYLKSSSF